MGRVRDGEEEEKGDPYRTAPGAKTVLRRIGWAWPLAIAVISVIAGFSFRKWLAQRQQDRADEQAHANCRDEVITANNPGGSVGCSRSDQRITQIYGNDRFLCQCQGK